MKSLGLILMLLINIFILVSPTNTLACEENYLSSEKDSLQIVLMVKEADSLKDINYRQARVIAARSLVLARQLNSNYLLFSTLSLNSLLDWYNGEHTFSLQKSFEGLEIARREDDLAGQAKRYRQIGLVYLYTADYDSALKYNKKALADYMTLQDTTGILKIHGYFGLVYDHQADYVKAKENLLSTVLIKRQARTSDWNVLQISSGQYTSMYYSESLISAKKDLAKISDEIGPSIQKRSAYYNLGVSYLNLNHPDSALIYYRKSANVARELNMDIYWNEFAKAYTMLGYYDSALLAHKKALVNAIDHGTRINQATSYSILGESFLAAKNFDVAIAAFKNEVALDKKMGHKHAVMRTFNKIAECELGNGMARSALTYADSSYQLAKIIGARKGMVDALLSKYRAYDLLGNYKKSLSVKKRYDAERDVLHEQKTLLDLAKMDLFNEVELKKLEIIELNRQQQLYETNLKNRTLTLIIILTVAVFILLLLFLNYLRTRKLLKLNIKLNVQQEVIGNQYKELAISNKEKEVLLGEIHHRVKNNLQVISSLLSVQRLQLSDEAARQAVLEGQNRVQTMGLIHESLYQNEVFDKIDMGVYLEKLANNLISSFGYYANDVNLKIDVTGVTLEADPAINIGLITNELVTNALKHAFSDFEDKKELSVSLHFKTAEELELVVRNNGSVNKEKFKAVNNNSFGLKLVKQIIRKYKGSISFDVTNKTEVKINMFIV